MMKTFLRWAKVALLVFVGLVVAREATAADKPVLGKHGTHGRPLSGLPGDFLYIGYRNYLYTFFFDMFLSWDDAWHFCYDNGGELVTIETRQIEIIIVILLHGTSPSNNSDVVWTAGQYDSDCNYWSWVYAYVLPKIFFETDGHTRYNYGFTYWWRGEPHNTDGFCVGISLDSDNFGRWITVDCSTTYSFICEWNECQRWSWDEFHCIHQRGCWYNSSNDHCERIVEVKPPPPPPVG